ncbi:MAG: thermonuclease family protein [Candidatus Gastranaerophilales bacterium]|nr:thermonuclease family protein [Candidatus Gastranaerophilales bacterium]
MKKIFLFFLLLFSFVTPAFSSTKINVIKVYDGDTILAQIEDNIFRIRLINIDCFEGTKSDRAKWQARKYKISLDELIEGGNIAGDILAQKLKNKNVTFKFMGIDKYNRALGIIYIDERNINDEMLKTNYCKPYKR